MKSFGKIFNRDRRTSHVLDRKYVEADDDKTTMKWPKASGYSAGLLNQSCRMHVDRLFNKDESS